jgi:hypothetical protein
MLFLSTERHNFSNVDSFSDVIGSLYCVGTIDMHLPDAMWPLISVVKFLWLRNLKEYFLVDRVVKALTFQILST